MPRSWVPNRRSSLVPCARSNPTDFWLVGFQHSDGRALGVDCGDSRVAVGWAREVRHQVPLGLDHEVPVPDSAGGSGGAGAGAGPADPSDAGGAHSAGGGVGGPYAHAGVGTTAPTPTAKPAAKALSRAAARSDWVRCCPPPSHQPRHRNAFLGRCQRPAAVRAGGAPSLLRNLYQERFPDSVQIVNRLCAKEHLTGLPGTPPGRPVPRGGVGRFALHRLASAQARHSQMLTASRSAVSRHPRGLRRRPPEHGAARAP